MSTKQFIPYDQWSLHETPLSFTLGTDRTGKTQIHMHSSHGDVAIVTAPGVTMWPRVDGDGNYGTMWGPQDPKKAKFTLDLTDQPINNEENHNFKQFMALLEQIDDSLLEFVYENQMKVLGRKNLSREEIKMLQIRSVRPKHDKMSAVLQCHSLNLSLPKYGYQMGAQVERKVTVCDHTGKALPHGQVSPGDVVAATIYANQVYTGVGGDKFGIHWCFNDVSVVCQRMHLLAKTDVNAFGQTSYAFAHSYVSEPVAADAQGEYPTGQFDAQE